MDSFTITRNILDKNLWEFNNPILIVFTELDLLGSEDLQFKILYENNISLPSLLKDSIISHNNLWKSHLLIKSERGRTSSSINVRSSKNSVYFIWIKKRIVSFKGYKST